MVCPIADRDAGFCIYSEYTIHVPVRFSFLGSAVNTITVHNLTVPAFHGVIIESSWSQCRGK